VASRGTLSAGNAIVRAAKEAKQTMLEMAADMMDAGVEEVKAIEGGFGLRDGSKKVTVEEVLHYCYRTGRRLLGKGWWCVPKVKLDPETNQGDPFHIFAFGTQVAEVEVDIETGQVEVKRVVAAHDVGKAINPALVKSQLEGSVVMGLGFTLSEELVIEGGYIKNPSLSEFLIPTAKDSVEIVPIIVEDPYPNGPFGAKGVGEPGCVPTAAAVANAVYDAIGVRITKLPLNPERVWRALQAHKGGAGDTVAGSSRR